MGSITIGTAMMQHPTLAPDEVRPDSVEPRLEEAAGLVQEAARRNCDFFCLPELFADPSQGPPACPEPIGGLRTPVGLSPQHPLRAPSDSPLQDGTRETRALQGMGGRLAIRSQSK